MQQDKLKVLVVGCGNMGSSHARAYHKIEDFEIVGLVSRGAASRERLSAELGGLMRRLIQKDNDKATVEKIAKELQQWAGDNRQRRQQLRTLAQRVIRAGYGTEAAQAELKKLVGQK